MEQIQNSEVNQVYQTATTGKRHGRTKKDMPPSFVLDTRTAAQKSYDEFREKELESEIAELSAKIERGDFDEK